MALASVAENTKTMAFLGESQVANLWLAQDAIEGVLDHLRAEKTKKEAALAKAQATIQISTPSFVESLKREIAELRATLKAIHYYTSTLNLSLIGVKAITSDDLKARMTKSSDVVSNADPEYAGGWIVP